MAQHIVSNVFEERVVVCQDSFHEIQRFTDKLKNKAHRKALSSQLSSDPYTVPIEMG